MFILLDCLIGQMFIVYNRLRHTYIFVYVAVPRLASVNRIMALNNLVTFATYVCFVPHVSRCPIDSRSK